jgi:hypothetical protein
MWGVSDVDHSCFEELEFLESFWSKTILLQVLQVLVSTDKQHSVWAPVAKPLSTLNRELANTLVTPEHNELTFANFLHLVGSLFGKDPEHWERQGRPKIEYSERDFIR